ncbi:MAG: efflux transporter periplasmic adaptor subunit, partial [Bacteroidota bacterium]|nr:efflux transporter periplasmic adaptor subunit [Bacteroidota bacterium]
MKKILFLSIFFLAASCGQKKEETQSADTDHPANLLTLSETQLASAQITTGKLETRALSSQIKVTGKIDVPPQNMISISVPLGGYLLSSHLLPGMQVKKGEVIAILEDQQYIQLQQDYLTCQSKINYLAAEYARQKTLNESKTTSDKIFQQTQMEYSTQKINLAALGEKL